MINEALVREIIATYVKHGWILRRVLLSADGRMALRSVLTAGFADVPVNDAQMNAAWFSRPPKQGSVAWELRHFSEVPYALLEFVDEHTPEFEKILCGVESKLAASVMTKDPA